MASRGVWERFGAKGPVLSHPEESVETYYHNG